MQKIILLNFEQNDQKKESEPDHVMLDRIKMSKTAATAKKWAAQQWVASWKIMVRHTDSVDLKVPWLQWEAFLQN